MINGLFHLREVQKLCMRQPLPPPPPTKTKSSQRSMYINPLFSNQLPFSSLAWSWWWRGWGMGGLGHGILCTFLEDGMRGQEQKSHHPRS